MKGYGAKLKELRLSMNLTQEQLASILNVGASSIAMYEAEERIPKDALKIKLSEFFDKSVEEIFFNKNIT